MNTPDKDPCKSCTQLKQEIKLLRSTLEYYAQQDKKGAVARHTLNDIYGNNYNNHPQVKRRGLAINKKNRQLIKEA
jgi:hypothetical protein